MDTWTVVVVCSSIVLWACVYCCLSILRDAMSWPPCGSQHFSMESVCVWPFHMLCGDG
jgi:hypothetical protein